MILITGGTGFVGKALIRQLVELGQPVRILIRPTPDSPSLPKGVPVDVALSGLTDDRGLRAAMVGVDTVFHLATGEWRGTRASLMDIDIQGTRSVVEAAQDAGVRRFFYVSHLGADRASAYPILKAKGIAEEYIRKSSLDFTILRTAILFGPNDGLTTGIARLLGAVPSIFLIPGNGEVLLQPLWVEDLVTALTWAMEDPQMIRQSVDLGGPEYLKFRQVVELVMQATGMHRRLVSLGAPYLRGFTVWMETIFPGLPTSVYWLDYLAANRTTSLDTAPRVFGLLPSRMSQRLAYLEGQPWRTSLFRTLMKRR
jgi:NADH dehydrogenase